MPILDVCDWHFISCSSGSWNLFSKAHRSHLLPRGGKRGEPVLRQRREMRYSVAIPSVYFWVVLGCNVSHQSWTKPSVGALRPRNRLSLILALGLNTTWAVSQVNEVTEIWIQFPQSQVPHCPNSNKSFWIVSGLLTQELWLYLNEILS